MASSSSRRLMKKSSRIQYFHEEDILSNLPESILHHILSFLDMKYVVQTSILSRTWRYIWVSHPTINLDTNVFYSYPLFKHFVDQVLILHDNSNMNIFNLICNDACNVSTRRLNTWILAALRRNVQQLSVDIHADETLRFPSSLFTCQWLTKLVLKTHGYGCSKIFLPDSVDLPALRVLHLESISFINETSTNNFISGCPALDSFEIENGDFSDVNLNISSLKLRSLCLDTFQRHEIHSHPVETKVTLYAPNLLWLFCKDYMSKDYSLGNLSSLVAAGINMEIAEDYKHPERYSELPPVRQELCLQRMMKLLRTVHNVKNLTLSPGLLQVVSRASNLLDTVSTRFSNLSCLKLDTWLSRDCIHGITYLLKISPNIQTLYLQIHTADSLGNHPMYPYVDEMKSNSADIEDYWEAGSSVEFMLHHLKIVDIKGFAGRMNELKFIEIILRNAMVLEEVMISMAYSSTGVEHVRKFKEKLLKLPRASSSIAFMIYSH